MQNVGGPIGRLCGIHPRWLVSTAFHNAADEDGDEFEGNIVGREGGTLCEEIGEGKVRVKGHCLLLESDTHLEDGRNLLQSTLQVILADIIEIAITGEDSEDSQTFLCVRRLVISLGVNRGLSHPESG